MIYKNVSRAMTLSAVLLHGCGDSSSESPPQTPPTATQQLPADVARVLQAACVSCHARPTLYGAPMPLVTYADTQQFAVTQPTKRVWELMGTRIHDTQNPMPPTRLGASDTAILDAWIAARAPACTGSQCGTVNPHTFTAHANAATTGYRVAAASGNTTKCFAFRSPFVTPTQATTFGARIDNASVLHHMILYSTNTALRDGTVFDCDGNMPRDARFVAGWAPGNRGTEVPPDVGIELPDANSFFILQVHYWNLQNTDAVDASGLAMCTTTELRPHSAAVATLGSLDIAIPARAQGHDVVGNCTPTITEPVHIIGNGPHMHRLGVGLKTEILRGGAMDNRTMLVNVENFSFDSQVSYPVDTLLMPGDVIRTTCRYNNPGTRTVYFGERTEDEMCFNFVLAWPAGALSNTAGRTARRCIDARTSL
jgi:hypothetical protein